MSQSLYIEPLDILFLRDNHLFGNAAGDTAGALMPPWPSVFAGAIRSRMLADAGVSISALKNGALPAPLHSVLGTPETPGDFTLGAVCLAQAQKQAIECCHPLPADLVVTGTEDAPKVHTLRPQPLPAALATSNTAAQLPILRTDSQAKPLSGFWLTAAGWQAHVQGQPLEADRHLIRQSTLWQTETRLGIELDGSRRSAADGALYTSDAVAMPPKTGFCVSVHGADGALPTDGLLRLGGDGRGARVQAVDALPAAEPDWDVIHDTGRFRLILTSPGMFPNGHQPPGIAPDGQWRHHGARARLVSQAVPRHSVVSGWDLAAQAPKTAQRCAPAGSVYWFEGFEGDIDSLRKLSETGLWNTATDNQHASRRAEGFNRVAIANA